MYTYIYIYISLPIYIRGVLEACWRRVGDPEGDIRSNLAFETI